MPSLSTNAVRAVLAGALLIGTNTTTLAQTPFTAGWRDGFQIQTEDGDFRLQFGLVGQLDGRFVTDDPENLSTDTFSIRKLRPILAGRVARYFDFQVVPDLGSGAVILLDAYFDLRLSPALRVRTGKAKSPIGYEVLLGDPFLLFPERALTSSLIPNRDVGVQLLGDFAGGRFSYQAAVLNGLPDGTNSTTDVDTNDSKDLAGRIVVQPFRRMQNPGPLNGLGFAVGGSTGTQVGALPAFRTSIGQRYFAYDPATAASGSRTRITPSAFFYYKALGAFAEWAQSTQQITRGAVERDITNDGWDVTASFVVTGEAATERGVRPRHNFDPATGQWGALQLVGRYSELNVDDAAFDAGFVAAGASQHAKQVTLGANWYPAAFIKYYITYEHITFDGPLAAVRADEQSIFFRAQIAF